ncbi:MAG TPA: hypothetical protein VGL62_13455 [Vicinamibacterales bacterium]|jgi:hypothetical protein
MTRILPAVVVFAIAAPLAAYAQAQSSGSSASTAAPAGQSPSLEQLAKDEAARRKAAEANGTAPKKVYTNDDLKPAPPPPNAAGAAGDQAKSADTAADAQKANPKDAQSGEKTADDKTPSEQTPKYWHDRMQQAQDDLQHNQMYAEALQSRINGLAADFAARDDPNQRAQIADDRQKALAELNRVHDEIDKGKQRIADIEEDARKANIPAGWIR